MRLYIAVCLVARASALQVSRRRLFSAAAGAAFVAPLVARADGLDAVPVDPFNSMCFGFGCNAPRGVDDGLGAPAPTDEASLPWADVMVLIDAGAVGRVEFDDVSMNKAWFVAVDGGARTRIGAGYPVEDGRSWSSPLFVTRILDNRGVPYGFAAGLKRRSKVPN